PAKQTQGQRRYHHETQREEHVRRHQRQADEDYQNDSVRAGKSKDGIQYRDRRKQRRGADDPLHEQQRRRRPYHSGELGQCWIVVGSTHESHPVMNNGYDPSVSIRGDGDPLVLVPGINGSGALFYRQVPLLERSYRVATYSLRDDAAEIGGLVEDLAQVGDRPAGQNRRGRVVRGTARVVRARSLSS